MTDAGRLEADAYLVALGSYSPLLLRPLGIRIPVYPVKGYSITVPITDAAGAPESTVMDETHKVAVTRLGERIRVGGTAELAGYTLKLHEARRQTLEHVVSDLFPRGGDVVEGRVLVRPAPDDAGRHAGGRADADRQPVPRDRPRHARLDDGRRHRPGDRRPDLGTRTGDRPRRASRWHATRDRRDGLAVAERSRPGPTTNASDRGITRTSNEATGSSGSPSAASGIG